MNKEQQVLEILLEKDNFSRWLGIRVEEITPGGCILQFTIRPDMLNGFGTVHGGVIFSAADSAFAFACNSHGRLSVALDVHISFIAAAHVGDILRVEAKEIHLGDKTGFYDITTTNQAGKIISVFKGTAYRTGKSHL